ncbi:MAG: hypothetical protein WAV00_11240 [Nocardioides sp.]
MSAGPAVPMKVWSRPALRYHLAFFPAIAFCFAAGWFELTRAREGHTIAWVYVFEWPVFGVLFAWMWWHIVTGRDTRRPSPPSPASDRDIPEDDPGLQAWRAYLAEHEGDNTERAPGSG